MTEFTIHPQKKVTGPAIEKICRELGLLVTMKGSLKSIAENTHWHFKNGKLKGELEITLMHKTGKIVLSVHENRRGGWEDAMFELLKKKFV